MGQNKSQKHNISEISILVFVLVSIMLTVTDVVKNITEELDKTHAAVYAVELEEKSRETLHFAGPTPTAIDNIVITR